MIEKMIVLVIVFGAALAHDLRNLAKKSKREVIIYGLFMTFACYLGVDYLVDVDLPDFKLILDWTVTKPGLWISDYLEV